jgi:hypothetical protein
MKGGLVVEQPTTVGMFTRRACLSLMARTTTTMTNRQARKISKTGRQGRTTTIEWQDQQCKLRRRKTVKARQRFSEFRRSGNPKERGSNSRYAKERGNRDNNLDS